MVNYQDRNPSQPPNAKAKVLKLPLINGKIHLTNEQLQLLTPSREIQSLIDKSLGYKNILIQIGHSSNHIAITKPIVIEHMPRYKFHWSMSIKTQKLFPETWENFKPYISNKEDYDKMIYIEKLEKISNLTKSLEIKEDLEYLSNQIRLNKKPELIPAWILKQYENINIRNIPNDFQKFLFREKFKNSFELTTQEYNHPAILHRYRKVLYRSILLIDLARKLKYTKSIIIIPTHKLGIRLRKVCNIIPKLGDKIQKFNIDLLNLTRGIGPLFVNSKDFLAIILKSDSFSKVTKPKEPTEEFQSSDYLVNIQDYKENIDFLFSEQKFWSVYIPKDLILDNIIPEIIQEEEENDDIVILSDSKYKFESLKSLEINISNQINISKEILKNRPIKFEEISTKDCGIENVFKILRNIVNRYKISDSVHLGDLFYQVFEAPNCLRRGMLDYFLTQLDFWLEERSKRFLRSLINLQNSLKKLQDVLQP